MKTGQLSAINTSKKPLLLKATAQIFNGSQPCTVSPLNPSQASEHWMPIPLSCHITAIYARAHDALVLFHDAFLFVKKICFPYPCRGPWHRENHVKWDTKFLSTVDMTIWWRICNDGIRLMYTRHPFISACLKTTASIKQSTCCYKKAPSAKAGINR